MKTFDLVAHYNDAYKIWLVGDIKPIKEKIRVALGDTADEAMKDFMEKFG